MPTERPKPLPPMPDPSLAMALAAVVIRKAQVSAGIRPRGAVRAKLPRPPPLDGLTR